MEEVMEHIIMHLKNMKMIMNISDHITVVNFGVKLAEGTPTEISSNPVVIKAYLGEGSLHE